MEQSGEVKGMEMVMEMVMMTMMMIIPMNSSLMVMTMATISPLREVIPLADFSLPDSCFSLSCFRTRHNGGTILRPPLMS